MKCSILLVILFITGTVIYSQKITLVSDQISVDFKFNKKADSIAAEITITNFSEEKICIPVFPGSSVIPRHQISCVAGTLDIRIGASSRSAGIPLEFPLILYELAPQKSLSFSTIHISNAGASEAVTGFDYIKLDELSAYSFREAITGFIHLKASNYVPIMHTSRGYFSPVSY
jgi:hypothetical protein